MKVSETLAMLVVPLLNVQILARGSFPTVETKPVFFFFCPLLCRICSDDDEQMNWSHINNQENQSNVSLTSYCKNLHLFILFCIDNLN